MTVVAVGSSEQFNVLVTDAIIPITDLPSSRDDLRLGDKIRYWPNLSLYTALVGDELLYEALSAVSEWSALKERPISLDDARDVDMVLLAAAKARQAIVQQHPNMPSPQPTTLYMCGRGRAAYWKLEFDQASRQLRRQSSAPACVREGVVLFDYAGTSQIERLDAEGASAASRLWCRIMALHEARVSSGAALPYDLGERYSSVVVPTRADQKPVITTPFRCLSDMWAGSQRLWHLLESPDYQWSPF
ncbi:MAG TPA: hypothetical protein VEA99_16870 [Gemmatimonadaceae bacterium]|nr:hypothetical protein [Gemmatimonadaceae bacterium]